VPEKTCSTKRHPTLLETLERFLERIYDEPEHATHLTKKIARELAHSLGN
jgi:hypothetical protein